MIDWFTAVRIYVAPNSERERWKALQSAWLAMAEDAELEPEDDADDVWPLVRREFRARGVAVTLGAENFVEAADRAPIEGLVCSPSSCSVRPSFAASSTCSSRACCAARAARTADPDRTVRSGTGWRSDPAKNGRLRACTGRHARC